MIIFKPRNLFFIVTLYFLFYYFQLLFNASYIDSIVFYATLLIPILYIQSIGSLFFFYLRNNKIRLIDLLKTTLFIYLIVDFIGIVNNSTLNPVVKFSTTNISLLDSSFTLFVIFLAFLSLDIGYFISALIKNKKFNATQNHQINYKILILSLLIYTSFFQAYLLFSGLSGYGSSLEYTNGFISLLKAFQGALNPFAILISAYIVYIEKYKSLLFKNIFKLSIILQVLTGLLSGMKEEAIIPILYVLIVFLLGKNKIKKAYVIIAFFGLLILYPLNNSYRDVINNPYYSNISQIGKMYIAINNIINKPFTELLSSGNESFGNRTSMYRYLQYSINIEQNWNYYKNMNRYYVLPLVWIVPRAVWSNKPRSDIGAIFYYKLTGRTSNSITPTNVGWAYLEGGIFFIILIFTLLGIFFSLIDKKDIRTPLYLLIYGWSLHKVIKPEWDPYFMFAAAIQAFILYWILLKLIGVKNETIKQ